MTLHPKIAIFASKGFRTGGPEALHQLHYELLKHNLVSTLIPYPGTSKKVPVQEYISYEPLWGNLFDLFKADIVIISSDLTFLPYWYILFLHRKTKYIWMLAVDYSSDSEWSRHEQTKFPIHEEWHEALVETRTVRLLKTLKVVVRMRFKSLKNNFRYHLNFSYDNYLFQSNYAREIVTGFYNKKAGLMLTDYINIEKFKKIKIGEQKTKNTHLCSCSKKHVAYNPAKSTKIMDRLLDINQNTGNFLHFVAIKNLSKEQVVELLIFSDLYLDLGFFPGKDRLPREAITLSCPVLLAKRGSARYETDFSLNKKYLIDLNQTNRLKKLSRLWFHSKNLISKMRSENLYLQFSVRINLCLFILQHLFKKSRQYKSKV